MTGHDLVPPRPRPFRMLVLCTILSVAYLALDRLVYQDVQVIPWLLGVAIVVGAVVGSAWGTWEPEQRLRAGRRAAHGKAATGAYILGLTGMALILNRFLNVAAVPWVLLGCIALGVGLGAYEWVRARRVDGHVA